MQLNLKPGEVKLMTIQNETLDGIQFTFEDRGEVLSPDEKKPDAKKVSVKIILERDGKTTTIANETLYDLMKFTRFLTSDNNLLSLRRNSIEGGIVNLSSHSASINFTGNLHIKGTDRLFVEVDYKLEALSEGFDPAQSYMQVASKESMGYEYFVPIFRSYVISANEPSIIRQLGDQVSMIGFISHDEGPSFLPNRVSNDILTNFQLSSDKLKVRDDRTQLLAKRKEQFQWVGADQDKFQSFLLYGNQIALQGVEVELDFKSENLTAGRNRLMWVIQRTNPKILAKAAAQEEIHSIENAQAAGVSITPQMQQAKVQAESIKKAGENAAV